jgi:hypothetical protein
MLVWISGEGNLKEEKRLGEAIAGAYTRGISLHGETIRKEFKIAAGEVDQKARLVLAYRLAILAKILLKQDCLVVVAHNETQVVIGRLRTIVKPSLLVLINESPVKGTKNPFMVWKKKDSIYDRDAMVEAILGKIKEV